MPSSYNSTRGAQLNRYTARIVSWLRALPIAALVCAYGCAAPDQLPKLDSATALIFRYVDVGAGGRFELGEPFGGYAHLAIEEAPNKYRLREGVFGRAESIVVTTDNNGIVRLIDFDYGPKYRAWSEMLAHYTKSLGAPAQIDATQAVWNDGHTEFSIVRESGALYVAGAEMRDLESVP